MRRGVSTRDIIVRALHWWVINVGGDMVRMACTIAILYHTWLHLTTPDHILWYGLHGPAPSQAPTTNSVQCTTQIADHSVVSCQLTKNTKPDFRKSVGLPNSILHVYRLHFSQCLIHNGSVTSTIPTGCNLLVEYFPTSTAVSSSSNWALVVVAFTWWTALPACLWEFLRYKIEKGLRAVYPPPHSL